MYSCCYCCCCFFRNAPLLFQSLLACACLPVFHFHRNTATLLLLALALQLRPMVMAMVWLGWCWCCGSDSGCWCCWRAPFCRHTGIIVAFVLHCAVVAPTSCLPSAVAVAAAAATAVVFVCDFFCVFTVHCAVCVSTLLVSVEPLRGGCTCAQLIQVSNFCRSGRIGTDKFTQRSAAVSPLIAKCGTINGSLVIHIFIEFL